MQTQYLNRDLIDISLFYQTSTNSASLINNYFALKHTQEIFNT